MKPIHYYVFIFLEETFKFIRYKYHRIVNNDRIIHSDRLDYTKKLGNLVRVFVTGPSLNIEIDELLKARVDLSESVVVNLFADTELFKIIRPKYYCIVDPVFFDENKLEYLHDKILQYFNYVDWQMCLIVPDYGLRYIKGKINNHNISVKSICTIQYEGYDVFKFSHYKKGKASPSFINVSIFALFAMLNVGYKRIELYGADHNYFLEGLSVDDNNDFYLMRTHFYGKELMKIERYTIDGNRWRVSNLMWENYVTFKVHEELREYSHYLGAQIINCTKNSLIDAYVRKAQLENNQNKNIANI